MKKKQTRTATAKRTNAASDKGRKVHALTGDRPDAPTSSTVTDAARKVATRIISLYYHCAEAVYHIGNNDTRFSFERMYAQELADIRNEGIAETDIEQGGKLILLELIKRGLEQDEQRKKWQECKDKLHEFENLLPTLEKATPDTFNEIYSNDKIFNAQRLIWDIEEPSPLSNHWFMDDVYRSQTKSIKTVLSMSFEVALNRLLRQISENDLIEIVTSNEDLNTVRIARQHGIEVNLYGKSFENAKNFLSELSNRDRDTETVENIASKYSDIAAHLPDEIDFQRAIERAAKQGATAKAIAENAVSFLRDVSTLRGEELREHQRNRAAKIIKAKCLTIGEGALYYGNKLLEEAQRGGYGADALKKTPEDFTDKAIRSLDQQLRKHAEELGLSEYINKGKRGNRSRPSR